MKEATIRGYGANTVSYTPEESVEDFAKTLFRLIEGQTGIEFTSVEWEEADENRYAQLRFDIEETVIARQT